MKTYIIEEIDPKDCSWHVMCEIEASCTNDAAMKWIETRPLHTFRIREKT